MEHRLSTLDDPAAIRLLTAIALPRLRDDTLQSELTPDLRRTLADTFGAASPAAPSEGDLARQTLLFLARDPAIHPTLTTLLDGPKPEQLTRSPAPTLTGSKTLPVTVAVLLALQTHLHIERNAAGQWQILLDKPTASEELLKPIVQRLLAMPPEPARLSR
jgi:hypothetical protein